MLEQMRNIQTCEDEQRAAHALNGDRLAEEHDAEHRADYRTAYNIAAACMLEPAEKYYAQHHKA